MRHPRNPDTIYIVMAKTKIHINDQWVDGYIYSDKEMNLYTRPEDEFGKFKKEIYNGIER